MRVYHIAHELDRPNRAVLQLLRELGFTVASHMARLTPEEEAGLREAVERQSRGAPAVRAAHSAAPSVQASQVAEVVVKLDLDIQTNGEAKDGRRPGAVPARRARGRSRRSGRGLLDPAPVLGRQRRELPLLPD